MTWLPSVFLQRFSWRVLKLSPSLALQPYEFKRTSRFANRFHLTVEIARSDHRFDVNSFFSCIIIAFVTSFRFVATLQSKCNYNRHGLLSWYSFFNCHFLNNVLPLFSTPSNSFLLSCIIDLLRGKLLKK